MLGEQDVPLVPRANKAHADRVPLEFFVSEVGGAQAHGAGGGGLEKIATTHVGIVQAAGDAIEILVADLDLFRSQLHGGSLVTAIRKTGPVGRGARKARGRCFEVYGERGGGQGGQNRTIVRWASRRSQKGQ